MKYYKIVFDNNYAGCQQEMICKTKDKIDDTELNISFNEYMANYEYVAQGYDWSEGWDSTEDEECYYQDGYYCIDEINEAEYNELLEQGYELFI